MRFHESKGRGILLSLGIAVPCWFLGKLVPLIGGPVFGMLAGMFIGMFITDKTDYSDGIKFASGKILQYAVILLGFGLNLKVVMQTGLLSLPIIIATISTSLITAYLIGKVFKIPEKTTTLIGVGSSICGGSAIAATAPVIDADDEEIASAISVIFLFNILAALIFPAMGVALGFDTTSGNGFGLFAGTAVNDTSSVTATAATWDTMFGLGTATLDYAVTVKLTRTLAIIPITMALSMLYMRRAAKKNGDTATGGSFSLKRAFPMFILYFVLASLFTTIVTTYGVSAAAFAPFKFLSKFFIVIAMTAIGLNTDIVKLIRNGGKPVLLGFCCWVGITTVSLLLQNYLGLW